MNRSFYKIFFPCLITFLIACNRSVHPIYPPLDKNINCYIELEKDTIPLDEPVSIYLVIENNSLKSLYIQGFSNPHLGYYINSKTHTGFNFNLYNKEGLKFEKPDRMSLGPGRSMGYIEMKPKEQYKFEFILSEWAKITEANEYHLNIVKDLNYSYNKLVIGKDAYLDNWNHYHLSLKSDFVVIN